MALDPEELKKRRLERQQQRQADRRKLVVKLILAAFALLLVGVLLFVFIRPGEEQPPAETTLPTQEGTTATTPTDPTTVIPMAFTGNLNVTDDVVAAGGNDLDYTNAILDVSHLLADADISAVNFEGDLCDAPYGDTKSAPVTLAKALANAGVDLLQLANSYPINSGMAGLATTIDRVRSVGMEPVGVYKDTSEKGYTLRNVGGVKVAFVAFTKGMSNTTMLSDCVNVLYKDYDSTYRDLDTEGISAVLDAVAKEKPDLTVALLHWGGAYSDIVSDSQTEVRDLFFEHGVDAIIGTHPHHLHKMEFDPAVGTFVAYSLGDFLGEGPEGGSEYSVVLNLEITKDNATGETKITGYDYTPIYNVVEEGKPTRVVRIKEAMAAFENFYIDRVSQETYDAMKNALVRIEARIKGE